MLLSADVLTRVAKIPQASHILYSSFETITSEVAKPASEASSGCLLLTSVPIHCAELYISSLILFAWDVIKLALRRF